ncbi:LOW QUALITY PROTEIN: phenylalanine--tRNA ligase alpha subunit-like [Halichondria panicea]|uniref:LOW QUALITY PROTEIN: phenylalanine--tRNA ligase alpha subunit-like n=1 Tax=Halichondria panicea TaxID=6063 RepID=UPI00312BBE2D
MLYKIGQQEKFTPVKYFSIDHVFRNETLDATHLAEFHQIEGVVADYNLTLGDLIGVLNAFFRKISITQLRFKPAYNPYTEPSMEVFSYHQGHKKAQEVGNSGVFRPEMLLPMGLPEDITIIAWGFSLERSGIETIDDTVQALLMKIGKEEVASDQLKEFKKRKLINNECDNVPHSDERKPLK